jgi:hypothetical protein
MKYILSILCLVSLAVFSGCLKSSPYLDVSHTSPIIEFGISPANGSFGPFQYDSVGSSLETDIDTAVGLVIAAPQPLSKDVTITVSIDTAQISAFQTSYQASTGDTATFSMMPKDVYSYDSVVKIPAGHILGRMPVTLKLSKLPLMTGYALPFRITGSDGLITSGSKTESSAVFMWWFYRWY